MNDVAAELTTCAPDETTETVREYLIPASLGPDARDKVDKVNRRLAKVGLPPYQLDIQQAPDQPVYDDIGARTVINGIPHFFEMGRPVPCPIIEWRAFVAVTITGAVPRLGDWEPVAVLTRDEDAGVVTRLWPGLATEPDLSQFREQESQCQHCNTNRHRNDTYVIRHVGTGEMRQIGKNCLELFTGVRVNVPRWLVDGDGFDEMSEWQPGHDDTRWPVLFVLELTCAVVKKRGWVSRAMERDSLGERVATSEVVLAALRTRGENERRLRESLVAMRDEVADKAVKVRDHAAGLADSETGEYVTNLSAVARPDMVGIRNVALLCSAVASYARHEERVTRAAAAKTSTWQGEVKQRVEVVLMVVGTRTLDGDWGQKSLVMFVDGGGNRFKWFASSLMDWEPGDRVRLKGTIKEHAEYQGARETVLTRCSVLEHSSAAVAADGADKTGIAV